MKEERNVVKEIKEWGQIFLIMFVPTVITIIFLVVSFLAWKLSQEGGTYLFLIVLALFWGYFIFKILTDVLILKIISTFTRIDVSKLNRQTKKIRNILGICSVIVMIPILILSFVIIWNKMVYLAFAIGLLNGIASGLVSATKEEIETRYIKRTSHQ